MPSGTTAEANSPSARQRRARWPNAHLGFGLPPGVPSWGGMLSREGRQYMEMAPRLAIWPGLCLTIVVYSINMFGDALRDLLDPRLRGSVGRL